MCKCLFAFYCATFICKHAQNMIFLNVTKGGFAEIRAWY